MERMTKAAVAIGGAAVLLLGGAGTLAYWTDDGTASGTDLSSGSLTVDPGTCAAWAYTAAEGGGAVTEIVPGDTVETTCTFEVTGTGDHVGVAAVVVSDSAFTGTGALPAALTTAVSAVTLGGSTLTVNPDGTLDQPVALDPGTAEDLSAVVTVDFPYGSAADNTTQVDTATLDDLTVTVQQAHCGPSATPACVAGP